MARQALFGGCAPESSNDPATALQPILATHKRCKELLTAWSTKVAKYEHQFKVMDGAQKTLVVRENDAEGHQARVRDGTEELR